MPDDASSDAEDGQDEGGDAFQLPEDRDWFLAQVVRWTNNYGFEPGITLTVGGSVVSGTLISMNSFIKDFGEKFTSSMEGELRETFDKIFENYAGPEPASKEMLGREEEELPRYIHLRGAKTFAPDGSSLPTGAGVPWRGKISAVSGFSLGELRRS